MTTTTQRGSFIPWLKAVMALAFALSACKSSGHESNATSDTDKEILVFAASSLTEAFSAIQRDFEEAHPAIRVTLNFAGTQRLRTQIENGAPAQVFAAANPSHMRALHGKKLVNEPAPFAQNKLVLITPADNPTAIESLADLAKAQRLVIAGSVVPAGEYTETMLQRASSAAALGNDFAQRVMSRVVSRETNVRQTLQKVMLGEADSAIVYTTDAHSAGARVNTIPIPPQYNISASYPIATITGGPHPHLSKQFVTFVLSAKGKARLREFGFHTDQARK